MITILGCVVCGPSTLVCAPVSGPPLWARGGRREGVGEGEEGRSGVVEIGRGEKGGGRKLLCTDPFEEVLCVSSRGSSMMPEMLELVQ